MIGGERFSDRPDCVCPVIGSFLRSWNDAVGYADRQRLEPYASRVVGTAGSRRVSRIRRDICLTSGGANLSRGRIRRAASRLRMRARIAWTVGIFPSIWLKEGAGAYAARACFARGGTPEAFDLLDRLLAVGASSSDRHSRSNGYGNGNGNGNGNGHGREDLAIRAAIAAREAARSRGARESGSPSDEAEDRRRDRRAAPPSVRS